MNKAAAMAASAILATAMLTLPAAAMKMRCHNFQYYAQDAKEGSLDEDFFYGQCVSDNGTSFYIDDFEEIDSIYPHMSTVEFDAVEAPTVGKPLYREAGALVVKPMRTISVQNLVHPPTPPPSRRQLGTRGSVRILTIIAVYADGPDNYFVNSDGSEYTEEQWARETFGEPGSHNSVHDAFYTGSYGKISFTRTGSKLKRVNMMNGPDGSHKVKDGCTYGPDRLWLTGMLMGYHKTEDGQPGRGAHHSPDSNHGEDPLQYEITEILLPQGMCGFGGEAPGCIDSLDSIVKASARCVSTVFNR